VSLASYMEQDIWGVSYGRDDGRWVIQRSMSQQLGIRTRAEIKTTISWSTGQDSRKTILQINLWIPYARWDEASHGRYLEVALSDLQVQRGYYDSGEITLWTGGYLNVWKSYNLNLPE